MAQASITLDRTLPLVGSIEIKIPDPIKPKAERLKIHTTRRNMIDYGVDVM